MKKGRGSKAKREVSTGARGPKMASGEVAGGGWLRLGPLAIIQRQWRWLDLMAEKRNLSVTCGIILGIGEVP